jgi:hypothetical protein
MINIHIYILFFVKNTNNIYFSVFDNPSTSIIKNADSVQALALQVNLEENGK